MWNNYSVIKTNKSLESKDRQHLVSILSDHQIHTEPGEVVRLFSAVSNVWKYLAFKQELGEILINFFWPFGVFYFDSLRVGTATNTVPIRWTMTLCAYPCLHMYFQNITRRRLPPHRVHRWTWLQDEGPACKSLFLLIIICVSCFSRDLCNHDNWWAILFSLFVFSILCQV